MRQVTDRGVLRLTVDELTAACHGRLASGSPTTTIDGFSIDSRSVHAGDLFVAIRGARFDGHQFVPGALQRGAAGVVVSDASSIPTEGECPVVIVVEDTTVALQRLGNFVRRRSAAKVVAITGSVGKTTTKEVIATLLTGSYDVFRNEGNLNNHIGVPLSLLELRRCPQVAVVELGMNHAGEIRRLVAIAEPEMRVWTNVAEVHAAFFSSIDEIADAKAEILEHADSETELVANAGDARVMARIDAFPGVTTTFGVDTPADVSATDLRERGLGGMEATIHTADGVASLNTTLIGRGHVANLAAGIAVARRFGVPLDTIMSRTEGCGPQPGRGQVIRLGALTLVDDTYNSSPVALRTALEAVGRETSARRRVAILGEMLELGDQAAQLHEACGRAAAQAGFDLVVAVGGDPVGALVAGARAGGLPAEALMTFATSAEAAETMAATVRDGDVVLVKGSRGIRMDRIVDRIRAER